VKKQSAGYQAPLVLGDICRSNIINKSVKLMGLLSRCASSSTYLEMSAMLYVDLFFFSSRPMTTRQRRSTAVLCAQDPSKASIQYFFQAGAKQ
jgi:hypothetical protein